MACVLSGRIFIWTLTGLLAGAASGLIVVLIFRHPARYKKLSNRRRLPIVTIEVFSVILLLLPGYAAYQVVCPVHFDVLLSPADLVHKDVILTIVDGMEI